MQTFKNNLGLLVLRIGFGGGLLAGHGLKKLINFSQMAQSFPDPLGIGSVFSLGLCIFAEFFCAALVTVGFFTRWATLPIIINMLVAVFLVHKNDPFAKKELGLLYLIGFIAIYLLGSGAYALGKSDR